MVEVIRSKKLLDHCHIARAPDLVPVTTGDHFVFICGHGVSPSSPGDKPLQVFSTSRQVGLRKALAHASNHETSYARHTMTPVARAWSRPLPPSSRAAARPY